MRGRLFVLLAGALLLGCGGGGGGNGPTEPSGIPQVAGAWNGSWDIGGVGFDTTLQLTQNGGALTGTFALVGVPLNITGTIDSSRHLAWQAVGGGCGSLTGVGTANGLSPTRIDGSIDLNTLGCTNPSRTQGPVVWQRASSGAAVTGKLGTVEDLRRALDRLQR
jgi:hypothetical protein